jgi:hypothetical protein
MLRLTPTLDTNKHEQQRSALNRSERAAQAQSWLTDALGSHD